MSTPDLNLLVPLDVLLAEGSVARAARRLRLSPSAMSRTLARLREATGDPLLVRAGRSLVPTPRAIELRAHVAGIVQEAQQALRPVATLDLARLVRTFTLRTSDGFAESFGAPLLARVAKDAPRVRLRFVTKSDKESAPLRDGTVDLETGVVEASTGPELRAQGLFHDRFVGVVRNGPPALRRNGLTPTLPCRTTHPQLAAGERRVVDRCRPRLRAARRATSRRSPADSRSRWRSHARRTSSPRSPIGTRRRCAPTCTPSPSPSRPRRSPSRCSGIRASTPMPRIAGCDSAFARSAPRRPSAGRAGTSSGRRRR